MEIISRNKNSRLSVIIIGLLILVSFQDLGAQTLSPTAPGLYNKLLSRNAILSDSVSVSPFKYSRSLLSYFSLTKELISNDSQNASTFLDLSFNEYSEDPSKSDIAILKHFYLSPGHMFELDKPGFRLRVNPILDFKVGQGSLEDERYFLNIRGLEIRGSIDNKVHFYTNILENQGRLGNYVDQFHDSFNTLPGEGLVKTGNQSSTNSAGNYDWLDATGYVQFNATKAIGVTLGHSKNFIGDGYRSLILSDFSDNYFQLRLDTRIGKFHYQNIFAEISANGARDERGDELLRKKYFTAHTLSFNPSPKLNIYLYETVVFGREEGFELQYLNPIIFYRAVEGGLGSPDNVLLGLGSRYIISNRIELYGQFMLDEFRFAEIKAGNGWWANKFSLQLGAKWINAFGIKNLDGQIEYNQARPYIYSHRDSLSSYAHYNQPLAHPLGANFREVIFKARYNINYRWFFDATIMIATVGEDSDDTNFGNNVLVSHNTRGTDYGNETLQGVRSDILLGKFDVSYMLRHNLFIDLSLIYRNQKSDETSNNYSSTIINGGVRMNIKKREHIF